MPRWLKAITALVSVLALTGCQFLEEGVNALPLPGTEGTGQDAFTVRIEMPRVNGLKLNTRVRVNDVDVGTISDITLEDWHAVVTVSLNGDVQLPDNATAKIGQTSLLGSKHLELAPPKLEPPVGQLEGGDTIPLSRAGAFPETETVLASLSLLLNGGGLAQLATITTELNNALGGRQDTVRQLLDRLEVFFGGLQQQKADIVAAIEGLKRLGARVAEQNRVLANALETIPRGLHVLNREQADLTKTLVALNDLGQVATQVVNRTREDILTNLRNLGPTLAALADAGDALPKSLMLIGHPPFPQKTSLNAARGDYLNLNATFDLTLPTLDTALLSGTPLEGMLAGVEGILGQHAGISGQARNPLRAPLRVEPPSSGDRPTAPGPSAAPAAPTRPKADPRQSTPSDESGGLGSLLGGLGGSR